MSERFPGEDSEAVRKFLQSEEEFWEEMTIFRDRLLLWCSQNTDRLASAEPLVRKLIEDYYRKISKDSK